MTSLPPPTSPRLDRLRDLRVRVDKEIAAELAKLRRLAVDQADQHRLRPRHRTTRGHRP